jgi:membrane associated rhomboid family serine protease
MLIPIADENPTRRFPAVTIALLAINIAVFAFEASMPANAFESFLFANAFVPAAFARAPFALEQWRTVFVSMFLHGGWLHVGSNMLYLWIFGNNVEDEIGHIPFVLFYLTCGVAATMAQFLAGPSVAVPNIGASGAVAGVLGAYLLLYPRAAVLTVIPLFFFLSVERLSAFFVIAFWFVLQLLSGVASLSAGQAAQGGGVAFFAHIGGFMAGIALIAPVWAGKRRSERY